MTPLPMLEASSPRSGATAVASDDAVPKGDGEFADFVDAPATRDEPTQTPADDKSPTAEAVEDDLSPDLVAGQPDIPLLPNRTASSAQAEGPKLAAMKTTDLVTEATKLSSQADVLSEEGSLDGKVGAQTDKAMPAVKSAAQAIMEGRMPKPSTDADVKSVQLQPDTAKSSGGAKDPVATIPVQIATDQSARPQGMQAPIAEQIAAVPIEPKSVRDAERRQSSTDQIQLAADVTKSPSAPPTAATNVPVLTAAPTVMLDVQKQAANQSLAEVEAVSGLGTGDRVGTSSGQIVTTGTAPAVAPAGQQVAHQIAAAMMQNGGRATEIALNPEELGRVRISMTALDATITLNVLAERPETTDLLRRNIDALAQEFRALGYDDINFSFGGDGAAQADGDETPNQGTSSAEVADDLTTPTAHQPTSGLDLRL